MFKQKKQKNTAAENRLGANQKIGILFCAMVSAVATGYVPNYKTWQSKAVGTGRRDRHCRFHHAAL